MELKRMEERRVVCTAPKLVVSIGFKKHWWSAASVGKEELAVRGGRSGLDEGRTTRVGSTCCILAKIDAHLLRDLFA